MAEMTGIPSFAAKVLEEADADPNGLPPELAEILNRLSVQVEQASDQHRRNQQAELRCRYTALVMVHTLMLQVDPQGFAAGAQVLVKLMERHPEFTRRLLAEHAEHQNHPESAEALDHLVDDFVAAHAFPEDGDAGL